MEQAVLNAASEYHSRRTEALSLFRATEPQVPVFECDAREMLVRGGNRSGKTTMAAALFAAIATDRCITTIDGEQIECRWPHQKDRRLTMWCVGYQSKHIGQTLHRVLFQPGLFKVIKDEHTGMLRTFRPWDPADQRRKGEARQSPPLISKRYIDPKTWAWEHKGERVFTGVQIWHPQTHEPLADIFAYTSTGEPKAGDPVDVIWIDEHIMYPRHYAEWQARVIDREGRIIWSSWPRTSNNALINLSERAGHAKETGRPSPKEFIFTMSGNPFLSGKAKADALEGWDEDEKRARDTGEFLTDNLLIYPEFDQWLHNAIDENSEREDKISEILRESDGVPPRSWTRELVLDPGTSKPAVLFGAVPDPDEFGEAYVVYDEIYVQRLNAEQLAARVLEKAKGYVFERFIIDGRAARQTPMGMGITVGQAYEKAFEKRHLKCTSTGFHFVAGSDDFAARSALVHEALTMQRNGRPKLRIVRDKCPNLIKQMRTNVKILDKELVGEKPATGQYDDMRVCLEYWLSRFPQYIPPKTLEKPLDPAHREWLRRKKLRNMKYQTDAQHVRAGMGELHGKLLGAN